MSDTGKRCVGRRVFGFLGAVGVGVVCAGCAHPQKAELLGFLQSDAEYAKLPSGPERVDAIWAHAKQKTGSDAGAIQWLGSIAVREGLMLRHPFNTGLTTEGALSPNDKTGHFFAHAMWQYHDSERLVPVAGINGIGWEIVGEIKSWFSGGKGFDWEDIWANRLGREFGRRIHLNRTNGDTCVVPSEVIQQAEAFRPKQVAVIPRQRTDRHIAETTPVAASRGVDHSISTPPPPERSDSPR